MQAEDQVNEVEEIKQRIDIVDLISQYVTLKKAGANFRGVCPFHQEKTASMMVSPAKQIWKCFGCGKGGDHYKFVMEAENLEFGDALKLLAQKAGVTLQPRTRAEHQTRDKKETLYAINSLSSKAFHRILLEHSAGKPALEYLKKRGLTEETIKKFQIGFAANKFDLKSFLIGKGFVAGDIANAGSPEKFYERIMFPIYDVLGNVIAFTGRALGDKQPKYLNSPETPLFNKGRTLYGLNFAKNAIKDKSYVILVEGQMDVIALHQNGVEQTIASSGTAITETQLQILSKYTSNFVLAFDNDMAGRTTTKKVIEMLLRLDLTSKVVDFGQYKDAGELFEKDSKGWPEAVKTAQESIDWWIAQEIKDAGEMKFVENKKKVVKALLPVLGLVADSTRLDHYVQHLALAVESKTDSIYSSLQKTVKPRGEAKTPEPTIKEVQLTNEEQLLAVVLARPDIASGYSKELDQVIWQSADAERIALEVKKYYNDKTLTKNPSQFLSQVKTGLDTQAAGKVDSWQFWLSTQWGASLDDGLAKELTEEKLGQLATKDYERRKEQLAMAIKRAQEKGDINAVKSLMKDLSELAKERQ